MSTSNGITLQNAGLFSELAYAPWDAPDALVRGVQQGLSSADADASFTLASIGWSDITASLNGAGFRSHDPTTNTSFRVFANSNQIVIAFSMKPPAVSTWPQPSTFARRSIN